MYLKVTKAKEYEYLKIVESYRDKEDGKIKHRVLFKDTSKVYPGYSCYKKSDQEYYSITI